MVVKNEDGSSSLFVLPSRWEGMANALLEAMAHGLPVVTSDVEGVREVLGESGTEQIVSGDNPRDFAERIVAWATDDERARALGEANRLRIGEHFGVRRMVAAYQALYESLLRG